MKRLFQSKANRDAAFEAAGGRKAGLQKRSDRNQSINPKYVEDSWCGGQPTAFGDDRETFGVLYYFVKVVSPTEVL